MKNNKNSTFSTTYPDTILCCNSQTHKQGPEAFFTLFGKSWEHCGGYEPLFLASNYSCSGEMATTYGLFKKNNLFYEVYGTECSVWDFDGQWEPEEITLEAILHKINHGSLGSGSDYDEQEFATELKSFILSNMEKNELINYHDATIEQKFELYAKQFTHHDFICNNIVIDSLLEDFTYCKNHNTTFKNDYSDIFKEIFFQHVFIHNTFNDEYVYSFQGDNTILFITLKNVNHYQILISEKNIHHKDFSLFSISKDINEIGENIALSLLEKKDLFITTPPTKKIKVN